MVECNAGSDVTLVAENLDDDFDSDDKAWRVINLAEGSGFICPTNDDDESSFLAELAVATLETTSFAEVCTFPLLVSSDGTLSGFVLHHLIEGDEYLKFRGVEKIFFETGLDFGGRSRAGEIFEGGRG